MMERKDYLAFCFKGLAVIALLAVAYPFIAALSPSARAVNDSLIVVTLPNLEPGVVNSVDVAGNTLFVLMPSEEQLEAIRALDALVSKLSADSYRKDIGAYVYWAHSSKWGCPLEHKTPQDSRIKEWDKDAKWLGGYWDWRCEVSFDYAGRAIKTYQYTFNGYTWDAEGLKTPKVFKKNGDKYVVSIHKR